MLKRLPTLTLVALLVAIIGCLPGIAAPAKAQPRTVSVATHDLEPFVITRGDVKTGFTIDILEEIAKHADWTLDYVSVGNVSEQLKAVTDGRTDAAATAITITADRTVDFDFSQPILNAGLQIMVPTGNTERTTPGLKDFLALLFSKTMLIWLIAALTLAVVPSHIVWLMERRHTNSMVSKSYFPGIFQAFAWGLGMLAGQPEDFPRHWVTKALSVLWAFVGIIFVAYYTATLTANLTVEKFDSQISSPADLVGKKVCTVDKTTPASFLTTQGIGFTGVPTIDECYAGIRDNTFDAVVFDAPVLAYYIANGGSSDAVLVGTIFENEDYGIAFPIGSDLRKQADGALLKIREDGDYDLIKTKWFGSAN